MFTLIKNAELYTPEKIGVGDILLCFDKIVAIGKNLNCNMADTRTIDANGKIATPGFIDQHVHVTGGGGESAEKSRVPEILMTDIARAGVTTVVGLLGTDSATRSVENLVAKTRALNSEGITAYCLTGAYEYPSPTITGSVKNDITFISEVIGVKIAISDHRCSQITKEELTRLASQARFGGLIGGKAGVVHMHCGRGKKGLSDVIDIVKESDIPIRQFRPTHCSNFLEDAITFGKMGGNIDFTSGKSGKELASVLVEVMKKVDLERITFSSDSNGSMPHWNEKKEIVGMDVASMDTLFATLSALVLGCGIALETALKLITENVAKGLDLYPKKGRLASGSDADIVLLNKDFEIDTVIAKGKILVENGKNIVLGYYGK